MQFPLGCELSLLTTSHEIRPGFFKNYRGISCLQAEGGCQSWRTASSATNCLQISLAAVQGEKNFLLGIKSGHLRSGQWPPEDRQSSPGCCLSKDSAGSLFWGETCHFKHNIQQLRWISWVSGTNHDPTPRELTWHRTNLRDRTSATVLTIPLSSRQGSNTAIVFWPVAPLEGSHIFTQTWGHIRISVAQCTNLLIRLH